jgi:uroporphyrinogen-III synthase
MRVLVTRPQPQAEAWAADLRAHQLDAHALPLIAIDAPADPAPVHQAWRALPRTRLLMFVSPAAVHWFFQLRPAQATWPATCLAATPGPGTAQALLQAGQGLGLGPAQLLSPPEQAEQFDSETLWPVLSPLDWQGQRALIVSGGDHGEVRGRTWLAEQLRARGAQVEALLTYQRGPGHWGPAQRQLAHDALAHPAAHTWLFSSSQAIAHLVGHHLPAWPELPAPAWPQAHALVTHPKIAEQARRLGLVHIEQTRPTLDAVVQALRSAPAHVDTIESP